MTHFPEISRKTIFTLILFIAIAKLSIASTGALEGKVTDGNNGEGLPYVNVTLKINKKTLGAQTDFDGYYKIEEVPADTYEVKVAYIGYTTQIEKAVEVVTGKTTLLNVKICKEGEIFSEDIFTGFTTTKTNVARAYSTSTSISISKDGKLISNKKEEFKGEDQNEIVENQFLNVSKQPLSTFSIDVAATSYTNIKRFINKGQKPIESSVRIEELINYFNYAYPAPENTAAFKVITELAQCPWNDKHQLLHIGLQGKKIQTSNLPPSNLVFLIDVSGSMHNSKKLPLLFESIKLLTHELRNEDKVAIVVYAGSSGLVLPSTSGNNKVAIIKALESLSAGGSTANGTGIELAYKIATENYIENGNNRVILATDGDFNFGICSDRILVKLIEQNREEGVLLSVLGFGMGNYKDDKMQELANKGNGNLAYVDGIMEAKKVLINEFGGTFFTIAKDVKLELEFNPNKVAGYRLIGYENSIISAEDFKDDKKDAGEIGAGHTVTALYEIIPAGVESKYLKETVKLKYKNKAKSNKSTELLTVKLRYKNLDENKSKLIEMPVEIHVSNIKNKSEAFQFAAGVAQFGLLLKNAAYKHKADYTNTINLIKTNLGDDTFGYRAEFLSLVKKVKNR